MPARNGTMWGSGVGRHLVKPLADAFATATRLRHRARNSDQQRRRQKAGYRARVAGQLAAVAEASTSPVRPETIDYVEAHGPAPRSATRRGRRAEQIFGQDSPCAIGSVKALIGHMEAASGIAGLIKAALSLYRGRIPPSPYFTAPSPRLNLDDTGLFVNTAPLSLPGAPRRAAVNSLGIGGTNAFAVLEQAMERTRRPSVRDMTSSRSAQEARRRCRNWRGDGRTACGSPARP